LIVSAARAGSAPAMIAQSRASQVKAVGLRTLAWWVSPRPGRTCAAVSASARPASAQPRIDALHSRRDERGSRSVRPNRRNGPGATTQMFEMLVGPGGRVRSRARRRWAARSGERMTISLFSPRSTYEFRQSGGLSSFRRSGRGTPYATARAGPSGVGTQLRMVSPCSSYSHSMIMNRHAPAERMRVALPLHAPCYRPAWPPPKAMPPGESCARGYLCGAAFVAASAIRGCVHGEDWRADLLWTAVFEGAPLVPALGGGFAGNPGAAALEPAGEISRGGKRRRRRGRGRSLRGDRPESSRNAFTATISRRLGISIVFFVIAQATLHLFVVLFRALTLYAEDQEIMARTWPPRSAMQVRCSPSPSSSATPSRASSRAGEFRSAPTPSRSRRPWCSTRSGSWGCRR